MNLFTLALLIVVAANFCWCDQKVCRCSPFVDFVPNKPDRDGNFRRARQNENTHKEFKERKQRIKEQNEKDRRVKHARNHERRVQKIREALKKQQKEEERKRTTRVEKKVEKSGKKSTNHPIRR